MDELITLATKIIDLIKFFTEKKFCLFVSVSFAYVLYTLDLIRELTQKLIILEQSNAALQVLILELKNENSILMLKNQKTEIIIEQTSFISNILTTNPALFYGVLITVFVVLVYSFGFFTLPKGVALFFSSLDNAAGTAGEAINTLSCGLKSLITGAMGAGNYCVSLSQNLFSKSVSNTPLVNISNKTFSILDYWPSLCLGLLTNCNPVHK